MAAGAASAQASGDHKALVCVFLAGGNDHANTVVPRSGGSYASYQQARPTLALTLDGLALRGPLRTVTLHRADIARIRITEIRRIVVEPDGREWEY